VEYVGIDWSYRRAAWCAFSDAGAIVGEGAVSSDEDGLARLVTRRGTEVRAVVEMVSGAIWVRDTLVSAGWEVQIAHARKVRDVAPLACKTDKVDARVLAELCRRELVPELWVPALADRELRERLRRRMHLVRMRASAMNRIFGLLTQWGLRFSLKRLRAPDAMTLLEQRGVPSVWRRSIAEALAVIELLDARIGPLDAELGPLARADTRVAPLDTIPASAPCSDSRSRLRSATSRASARHANSSATRAWRRRSAGPATGHGPAPCRRRDRGRCAGPPSKPPNTPGDPATPGTSSTPTSPNAPARTPPNPPSPARS